MNPPSSVSPSLTLFSLLPLPLSESLSALLRLESSRIATRRPRWAACKAKATGVRRFCKFTSSSSSKSISQIHRPVWWVRYFCRSSGSVGPRA
ncbi:hypothetical protein F5Y19DRAFT_418811 [Xylariaceae sp. FL1651]|nr:hypothetical protein F5Y19DRAFT_418811 [Xylariaceae sp. FL1651]